MREPADIARGVPNECPREDSGDRGTAAGGCDNGGTNGFPGSASRTRITLVSPNAFELAWLTGLPVATRAEAVAALDALRARGPRVAYATSLRLEDTPDDALDLIVAAAEGAWRVRTPKLPIAVNGAGDLFSALFLHEWMADRDAARAVASAAARVYAVVAATAAAGARELALIVAQAALADPSRRFAPERL